MQRSRILLIISIIVFLTSLFLLTLQEKEKFASDTPLLYYRISDVLDYSKPSMDALVPFSEFTDIIVKTNQYIKAQVIMFETLNRIDLMMNKMKWPGTLKIIYGLAGSDNIASKSYLAIKLKACYDQATLDTIIPKTYIMENGLDMDRFITDTRTGNLGLYIMKKNVQRQEGFIITNDRNKIIDGFNPVSDFVVCQELLQDPLLVSKRKVNMRIYLLVVVGPKTTAMYMYNDGFMYYTPGEFKKGSDNTDNNITTGYIDRQVYVDNPLTVKDLLLQLAPAASNLLWKNIVNLMQTLAKCYMPLFQDANKSIPGIKFLIYGCDIAPSNDYGCKLMEVNKGPDLSYKDKRDGKLKREMVREALGIVKDNSTPLNFFSVL